MSPLISPDDQSRDAFAPYFQRLARPRRQRSVSYRELPGRKPKARKPRPIEELDVASLSSEFTIKVRVGYSEVEDLPLADLLRIDPTTLLPVRLPTWAPGARTRSSWTFSSTANRHLVAESGLEELWLQAWDLDSNIVHIVTQPFQLNYLYNRQPKRCFPDALLVRESGQLAIAQVTPRSFLDKPDRRRAHAATEKACQAIGIDFLICVEPPPIAAANLSWIRQGREPGWGVVARTDQILSFCDGEGATVADVVNATDVPVLARAALWHLLWRGELIIDGISSKLLDDDTVIRRASGAGA